MQSKRRFLWVGFVVLLLLVSCCVCGTWGGMRLLNWLAFETVWQVTERSYFDPAFGGVDWQALHDDYRNQLLFAGEEKYYTLLNEMLWQLNTSHLAVVPPGYWPQVEPTVLAAASPGIDLRLFEGTPIVTAVEPGSPADRAGLRPGYAIHSVDGRSLAQIEDEALAGMEPPDNPRHRVEAVTSLLLGYLYGSPGSQVAIAYTDLAGEAGEVRLEREDRPGGSQVAPGFPAAFVEFETTRLEDGIGYIRFNWFDASLARKLPEAISAMDDAPGLIIDLRGNPGGMREAAIAAAEQLVSAPAQCSSLLRRGGVEDFGLDPAWNAYEGPVVVLIDVMSKSSSEFFAACTQAIGRAVIVGERSPGSVGPAELMLLPNGGTLIYPTAREYTLDGTMLEGHGVIPDIEVALDPALLAQGVDSQLEAALDYLQEELAGPTGFALYLLAGDVPATEVLGSDIDALDLADEPLLTSDDMLAYVWDTHDITLTSEAYERIQQLFTLPVEVRGIPFVVSVGDERIYAGAFMTPVSSISYEGIVIGQPWDADRSAITIGLGYPSPEAFSGLDPRSDTRILQALEEAGVLE